MSEPQTEDEAVEAVRVAIQNWREVQHKLDPTEWDSGYSVSDFIVIAAAQGITDEGDVATSTCYFTALRQPKYRTLGLMAIGDEMVDDAHSE